MRQSRKGRPKVGGHKQENGTIRAVDDLAEFEEFKSEILPMFKKALQEKWTPKQVYDAAATLAACKGVTIALTDEDTGRSMAAIKDILDRSGGKAVEKQEVTHSYSKLPDSELDALLESQIKDLDEDEEHIQ